MFLHDNGIPLLETVSEENRRNHESGDHHDGYYRESYDPEMTDLEGLNLSQATFIGDGIIPLQTTAINNDANRNSGSGLHAKSTKKFSLLHTFIPSFIFVILAMTWVFRFMNSSSVSFIKILLQDICCLRTRDGLGIFRANPRVARDEQFALSILSAAERIHRQ